MLKYFENLVDPYTSYTESDHPPQRLWPFLRQYMGPFRKVFVAAAVMSLVVAFVEVGLLWYLGRVVDLLGETGPAAFWAAYG